MTSQFISMTSSSNVFNVDVFLLSSLVTDLSFMPVSWLVLQLWQFLFYKGWPEIRKSEILPFEFLLTSGGSGKSEIPNLAPMALIKSYCILKNASVTAFTISGLLRKNQQGESKINPPRPSLRLGLKCFLKRFIFEV